MEMAKGKNGQRLVDFGCSGVNQSSAKKRTVAKEENVNGSLGMFCLLQPYGFFPDEIMNKFVCLVYVCARARFTVTNTVGL